MTMCNRSNDREYEKEKKTTTTTKTKTNKKKEKNEKNREREKDYCSTGINILMVNGILCEAFGWITTAQEMKCISYINRQTTSQNEEGQDRIT